jgi:DDE superfamily endonuclease
METTPAHRTLQGFGQELYQALGRRRDALFELLEAALESSGRATLVRLSLSSAFRRRWPSAPDALADGTVDVARCRRLAGAAPARRPGAGREVWALDGTAWPRPAASTCAERTYAHRPLPGIPQRGLVPGWEYQWLVLVPLERGSWALPLDLERRGPTAGTPTGLAAAQLRRALRHRPAGAPRPVVTFDSQYDPVRLARAGLAADLLVRLTPKRRFYRPPTPYPGKGTRVRRHGPVFKTRDPDTHGAPDRRAEADDPEHGTVRVEAWERLHAQGAHDVPFAVVRVTVGRLPKSGKAPAPLWLAWVGGELPEDLTDLWRWYRRRFTIEHGFRFLKQDLGWTTARPASPEAADRWSWLLALGLWQLWLAREIVADRRLPWERAGPTERLSPGRVRRAFPGLLARLGSPARPPRRRGISPGRRPGDRPGPRERQPVARRAKQRAA